MTVVRNASVLENRVSFPAMSTEMQVWSVVPECVWSGRADTTLGFLLQGVGCPSCPKCGEWQVGAVLVSVLCAGFQLGPVGSSQGRGEMLRKILHWPQLLSPSLFSTAFFHLFPWNYNSRWLRCGPFTVIISFFFFLLFFNLLCLPP